MGGAEEKWLDGPSLNVSKKQDVTVDHSTPLE